MTIYANSTLAAQDIQLAIDYLSSASSNLREEEDGVLLNGEVAMMIGGIQDVLSNLQSLVLKDA